MNTNESLFAPDESSDEEPEPPQGALSGPEPVSASAPSALAFALGEASGGPVADTAPAPDWAAPEPELAERDGPPGGPALLVRRKYQRIFSYYGSKSKIAHLYPIPQHDVVVEPFAGSAAYSALHCERQVHINEKDDITASVWRFLLRPDALECVEQWFPKQPPAYGANILDLLPSHVDRGFVNFMRADIVLGTLGQDHYHTNISSWGINNWETIRGRLEYWIPKIAHWTLTSLDYSELENRVATWYVDPPYANEAGAAYRTHGLNYRKLAQWCVAREGQVIVCENEGADWLPFRFLTESFSRPALDPGHEVIWEKGVDPDPVIPEATDALAFALGAPDAPPAPPESPTSAGLPQTLSETLAALGAAGGPAGGPADEDRARRLVDDLAARGHRLFTREGRLFVESPEAQNLTEEDRAGLRALKTALLQIAPPRPVEKPPSLAVFLGADPPLLRHAYADWVAEPPPSLDGIRDIILNFETNGLDWLGGDEPIGVTIGTLDGQLHRYLPFAHRGGGNLDRAAVIRYLQHEVRNKRITNANTRFEVHMGRNIGVDFEAQGCEVSDVMHYAALLDDHRKRFALDALAEDLLGGVEIPRVDERNMAEYAAYEVAQRAEYQAFLVAKLREQMWPQLDAQDLQRVRQLEDDVIYPVCEMERNGSKIDVELLHQYHEECVRRHNALMLEISAEVGFAFEHTATGWQALLEHCHLKIPEKSYSEDVLKQYDHPLVKKAQLASQYASLDSKTFAAYLKLIDANGVIHYDIHQLRGDDGGTVSGRFSIGYVQQVPNHDNHSAVFGEDLFPRRLFIPATGEYLESDAMQIEYRLFAHFAENQEVFQAYRDDPLMSFHKKMWEMVKKYKPDMLYTHQKNFDFAKQYGAKIVKLAVMLGFITEAEANDIRATKKWNDPRLTLIKEIDKAFGQAMPEVDRLLDMTAHLAKTTCDNYCRKNDALHRRYSHRGFVRTILGRRSRFPDNYKTYIALNRILQGSGADVMKRKLVELHRERKRTGFLMRLTVHDAVAGDAQDGAETARLVGEILNTQSFPQLKVPILWSLGTGPNWAACKS